MGDVSDSVNRAFSHELAGGRDDCGLKLTPVRKHQGSVAQELELKRVVLAQSVAKGRDDGR
jgi:hypothetical protein